MTTSFTGSPPKPLTLYGAGALALLNASASISAVFRAGTPKGAAPGPDKKETMPIFTSAGAAAGAAGACALATLTEAPINRVTNNFLLNII